jgi:hypothetical protein
MITIPALLIIAWTVVRLSLGMITLPPARLAFLSFGGGCLFALLFMMACKGLSKGMYFGRKE